MRARAYLLYGSDDTLRTLFIEKALSEIRPLFTHTFGKDNPLGIADAHEVRRRAYIAPGEGFQIFFLWQADHMTPEAMEALLKLLEEPPRGSYFFLISQSAELPATLLSRLEKRQFENRDSEASSEGDTDDTFFTKEITRLKLELENRINEKNAVPAHILHKLGVAVQLSTMLRTTRVNPRYIIESYKLTK